MNICSPRAEYYVQKVQFTRSRRKMEEIKTSFRPRAQNIRFRSNARFTYTYDRRRRCTRHAFFERDLNLNAVKTRSYSAFDTTRYEHSIGVATTRPYPFDLFVTEIASAESKGAFCTSLLGNGAGHGQFLIVLVYRSINILLHNPSFSTHSPRKRPGDATIRNSYSRNNGYRIFEID